ncbi:MAG TPA: FIST N-terminal domain-containing protein [Kofleriaceae bacterium]|nr:FIST N-terminal domain-containing protein [Kofleriaceae bacterium]
MVAGQELGQQILTSLDGYNPEAVIVFASARFDHATLLRAMAETCRPRVIVGSSSAGEFTGGNSGEGSACALAISSPIMRFNASVATGVSKDRAQAALQVVSGFQGLSTPEFPFRTALVMTDALAGHADDLVEQLTVATSGTYEFAGGGAGDDAKFSKTHVFCGTEVYTDAVVALEILSQKPLGIGVQHGWEPASEGFRVTSIEGARIITLDGYPAIEIFEQHAAATNQRVDRSNPLPYFLHNILGIETSGGYRLRVPLSVAADGSVTCAAEIPAGATVAIMKTSTTSASDAAASATRSAVRALGGGSPVAALFFDCVATRLRLGESFGFELEAVKAELGGSDLVGCNTYGQIARADGQFDGFHNCTAVVLALPR